MCGFTAAAFAYKLVELFKVLMLPLKDGMVVNSFVALLAVFMIFKSESLRVKISPLIS